MATGPEVTPSGAGATPVTGGPPAAQRITPAASAPGDHSAHSSRHAAAPATGLFAGWTGREWTVAAVSAAAGIILTVGLYLTVRADRPDGPKPPPAPPTKGTGTSTGSSGAVTPKGVGQPTTTTKTTKTATDPTPPFSPPSDIVPKLQPSRSATTGLVAGLKAEYFAGTELKDENRKLVQRETQINFQWRTEPAPGVPQDGFSVRFTGFLKVDQPGRYRLTLMVDDGGRLTLSSRLLVQDWKVGLGRRTSAIVDLAAGLYPLKVEHFDQRDQAVCRLFWLPEGTSLESPVPASAFWTEPFASP